MSEQDVELVRRAFAAFQEGMASGNPAITFDLGLLSPNAKWIVPQGPGIRPEYEGRDEWLEFIEAWTEDFDWSIELERAVDAGDGRVVIETHQRAAGKTSGVPVELHMAGLWTVAGGQVVRMENFFDPAEAFAAAGLTD